MKFHVESLNKYEEIGGKSVDEESKIPSADQSTKTMHKQHRQCTYIQRNIEACECNHYCNGKIIKYFIL